MPRLVLMDDDGREIFAGDLSPAYVQALRAWYTANRGFLRAAAVAARVARTVLAPPPPRSVTPARATYLPPGKRKRGGRA